MMLERELFASFYILQGKRARSTPLKIGASVSIITHLLFFVVVYSVSIGPAWIWEVPLNERAPGGGAAGEIVEVYGRPLIIPPEVVRQMLGEAPLTAPMRPDFIAESSSVARGEANPNPRSSSPLPRSSGDGSDLSSAAAGSESGGSTTSTDRVEKPAESREPPPRGESDPKVVEATDRLPTVTSRPVTSSDAKPSDSGRGSEIAKADSPKRDSPTTLNNQDSSITIRGPVSVNAKGVGAVEEYRAYLERTIQNRWQIPPEANLLSQAVSLTLEFSIAHDGRLVSIRFHNSTGIRALDRAAQRAVELAAPFRPLPNIFPGPTQVFTDTFVYYPPP